MRTIKFRAKAINRDPNREYRTDYENGDWVYGLITELPVETSFGILPAEMKNENGVDGIEIDSETICEYTGIEDKNGKEIFENDIIKRDNGQLYIIRYINGGFDCCPVSELNSSLKDVSFNTLGELQNAMFVNQACEVIGNLFDNKELLEV